MSSPEDKRDDTPPTETSAEGAAGNEGRGYGGQPPLVGEGLMSPGDEENKPLNRLGHRLRMARLARNLTQTEAAGETFSRSYLSAIERGQIRPSLGALEKFAERYQVSIADLLRLEGEEAGYAAEAGSGTSEQGPTHEPPLLYPEEENE